MPLEAVIVHKGNQANDNGTVQCNDHLLEYATSRMREGHQEEMREHQKQLREHQMQMREHQKQMR